MATIHRSPFSGDIATVHVAFGSKTDLKCVGRRGLFGATADIGIRRESE
jgi:hypothetical protein